MIVFLDENNIVIRADLDYAISELEQEKYKKRFEDVLERYNILDLKKEIINYINGDYKYEVERFYLNNSSIFIVYRNLDKSFMQKLREYTKIRNCRKLQLVVGE